MATHNQVREVGYLLKEPKIMNEGMEGSEKILFQIRTIRRETEGYYGKKFEDVIIYYDGIDLMPKLKSLKRFDLVDIKGVFNVLTVDKRSRCPACGGQNIKYRGSSTFIYPIFITKINSLASIFDRDADSPEMYLEKHWTEVSNQALIIGTVVNEPELLTFPHMQCCRYMLGVNRKYYIKTQDELTSDYPWVYSYGQQAEWDIRHLRKEAVILVDGFIHNRQVDANITCEHCGAAYTYPDVTTEFVPYSLEYLSGHKTDEDIALEEEVMKYEAMSGTGGM